MISACAKLRAHWLRAIDSTSIDEALSMLRRGFPDRDRNFWESGLERQLLASHSRFPVGYLLDTESGPVGIMLTIARDRIASDGRRYAMVNLCGWYVEPAHRWQAPLMLRRIVKDQQTVFTDLTATPSVARINRALGFQVWSEGELLGFLGQLVLLPCHSGAEVLAFDKAGWMLREDERILLDHHAGYGCIAAVLCTPTTASPLLFRPVRRRGIPTVQLVYAESRRAVIDQRRVLARFLLARGALVLSVDAQHKDCPPSMIFRRTITRFFKGPIERDHLDYAYSEMIVFGSYNWMI